MYLEISATGVVVAKHVEEPVTRLGETSFVTGDVVWPAPPGQWHGLWQWIGPSLEGTTSGAVELLSQEQFSNLYD